MATINGSTSSSLWTYKLEVTENSYSIEDNTSSVTVTAYIGRASSTSYLGGSWSGSITVDGSTQNMSGTIPYPTYINGGGWLELSTKTFSSVPHASDGSKTASVSSSFSSSAFTPSSASASGDVVLTTIPRASTITSVTTVNVGSNTTITVDRKSSSFTHTITYTFGSLNGTIATKSPNTSISWTIPNTFYAQMPNDKTKNGTMTITTYNGNTQIGSSSSKTFTVSTDENACKPTVTGSVVDSNATTIAVTGDSSILIAGRSTASVSYTATPRNSASIKKVTVNNETAYSGTSSSAVTGTKALTNFNANKIDIVATDSRTYPDTKRLIAGTDYTLVPYIPLTCKGEVTRQTPTGDVLLLSFSGNFYSGTLGATTNSLTLVWKWREKGASTWEPGGTLVLNTDYTIDTSNNTYSSGSGSSQTAISLGSGFTYTKNYEIQLQYTDALIDDNIIKDGMRGIPIVNWGEDFFNVNGKITKNGVQVENGVEKSSTNLDDFKSWLISSAPSGTYLVNLNINNYKTGVVVEKNNSNYLSFIRFGYNQNAIQYKYYNGTWTEVILEKYYDKYQTSEFKTNKTWIDGKPIYRKVIETTQLVTNDTTIAHNISNVDRIWIDKAFMTNTDGVTWDIPIDLYGVTSTSTDRVGVCVGKSVIQFKCDTTWDTWWTKTVILEYIKTTD